MTEIFNWNNIHANAESFQKSKPFPFGFIENVFENKFYNQLSENYPIIDDKWTNATSIGRASSKRRFGETDAKKDTFATLQRDETLHQSWNELFSYLFTEDFFKNISQYTGITLTQLRHFHFLYRQKGSFDLPHTHHPDQDPKDYEYKVTMLCYFAKTWENGLPGATYISSEEDESTILFEPYNLTNTCMCFAETDHSFHGSRYMNHDLPRPSIQFTLA
tara:strand:- start:8492 stop:9148 length:657 start_codon:yes stop_codon:yes gene_type:complete